MTDVLAYIPIFVPHAWVAPVLVGAAALVVALVGGSMLANRGVARRFIALAAVGVLAVAAAVILMVR